MGQLEVLEKQIYGRALYYPVSDGAKALAAGFKLKTFTLGQIRSLTAAGLVITVRVNSNAEGLNLKIEGVAS